MTNKFKLLTKELKNRFLIIAASGISTFVALYWHKETLLYQCALPALGTDKTNVAFLTTNVEELLYSYWALIQTYTTTCMVLAATYQLFKFLEPGMYNQEREIFKLFLQVTLITYVILMQAYYTIAFESIWLFLQSFTEQINNKALSVNFEPKIFDYVVFFLKFVKVLAVFSALGSGVLTAILASEHSEVSIKKVRKVFLIITLILSGLLTPPDLTPFIASSVVMTLSLEFMFFGATIVRLIRQPIET